MTPLDSRKIKILRAIVTDYVMTAKPVGSERLLDAYQIGCKSATIRNEMAEMAEMGYLLQPHTSAGRIPTDRGYRYYVDELMNPPTALSSDETETAHQSYRRPLSELEEIVLHTCRFLSRLTTYPSLATDPVTQTAALQRVMLSRVASRRVLMVVLFSSGHVEHRLLELPGGGKEAPEDSELLILSNYLTEGVQEVDLTELPARLESRGLSPEFSGSAALVGLVYAELRQMASAFSERKIFFDGMNQMLRLQEFQDVERLEGLLAVLDEPRALLASLYRMDSPEVSVWIGSENAHPAMQECSLVATWYYIGGKPAGCIGVVGPTRMNYDRATAAVDLMAQQLSYALTSLSLS